MKFTGILTIIITSVLLTACGSFGGKDEQPIQATGGTLVSVEKEVAPAPEFVPEPTLTAKPIEVPRVKQAEIVGVLREMRANGCIISKLANTDGIHYSQLVITCDAVQNAPEVE